MSKSGACSTLSKQKNEFKRLKDAIELVKNLIERSENDPSYLGEPTEYLQLRLNALMKVKTFLEEFTWLKHKGTIERVKSFLSSDCSYRYPVEVSMKEDFDSGVLSDLSDEDWDEEFKKRLHRYECALWYASKKFSSLIGKSTINLMTEGDLSEGLFQFDSGVGGMDMNNVIPSDLVSIIPKPKPLTGVDILECARELQLLKELSFVMLRSKFKGSSKSKVAFLRYILESGDSSYSKERKLIYEFLSNPNSKLETLFLKLDS